jgi:hypothetical protein
MAQVSDWMAATFLGLRDRGGQSGLFYLYAARAARGFGDGFAAIILPACLIEIGFCGVLKIAYGLALLFSFRHVKPPEEREPVPGRST